MTIGSKVAWQEKRRNLDKSQKGRSKENFTPST